MKKMSTYRIIFIIVFILAITLAYIFNDVELEYNITNSESIKLSSLILNNFIATIKYLIPFVNIILLFIEVLYNAIAINSLLAINSKMLIRVIFHLPFEVIAIYCCYMISYMVIFDKKEKVRQYIIIYIISLIVGALIEIYISGRLS